MLTTVASLPKTIRELCSRFPEAHGAALGKSELICFSHPGLVSDRNGSLALHEIRLALAHVLWHFDLSPAEESTNWIQQKSFIVWEKSPLMVKLTRAA